MKKLLLLLPGTALISACSFIAPEKKTSSPIAPSMLHHSDDTKGSAHFPEQRDATGKKVVIFSPKATAWAAYNAKGIRIKTGRASGGKHFCADVGRGCKTSIGAYQFYSKKGADCKSSKYPIESGGGAPMPYCMHFNGGFALHGSYSVPDHNASHGCVRVLPSAAKWLSENFVDVGTSMVVNPY
mgnify:FL=1